ncbi:MAG: beta-ketoacyl-ACP synthase II [Anaerolineae bacterium]|nr:beta-ketoacyl-ACP synthase II [Anaerolineae bacterium]
MKRIVITGMGMVTPLGLNVEDTWAAVKAGKPKVGPITRFDTTGLDTWIGAEIKDWDPSPWIGHKEARRTDRFAQYAIAATMEALAQANYEITAENTWETGVLIGAGFGGAESMQEGVETLFKQGPKKVKPLNFPMVISNMGSAQVAIRLGIKGINYSINAACATSAVTIGESAEIIRRGDAEVMIAGGSEAGFAQFSFAGLNAMRALTTRNDDPLRASRPFDKTRDGFVPAEGAAVVVLETLEHAKARGATILGELLGYAQTCDAVHVSAPDPEGHAVAYAMRRALEKANLTVQDIDYINAHGTSTPLNDAQETKVIKMVFGEQAYNVPISSTKSVTGHAMSSSGSFEAIFSLLAIRDSLIPPTINYEVPDPDCDLDYVPNEARPASLTHVMSNSFGFGGQNAVLVLKKYTEDGAE